MEGHFVYCVFVLLFVLYGYGFLSEKDRGMKFCTPVGLLSGHVFSPFGELWLAEVTGAAPLRRG